MAYCKGWCDLHIGHIHIFIQEVWDIMCSLHAYVCGVNHQSLLNPSQKENVSVKFPSFLG